MSKASVERISDHRDLVDPTDITPPKSKVPALGMSLQVDLGAGRVCTLQTFVSSDCSAVELNKMLDKMTAAGARQRSSYRIEELERDLEKFEKEQAQGLEDLETAAAEYETAQKRRADDAAKAVASIDTFEAAAKAAAEARGQRGAFVLKGTDKQHVDRVRDGVEKLKGQINVEKEEHDKIRAEMLKTIDRRAALIAKTKAEIQHCKDIVAAGLKE